MALVLIKKNLFSSFTIKKVKENNVQYTSGKTF